MRCNIIKIEVDYSEKILIDICLMNQMTWLFSCWFCHFQGAGLVVTSLTKQSDHSKAKHCETG